MSGDKLPIVERLEEAGRLAAREGWVGEDEIYFTAATTIAELVSALESLVKGECPDCKGWGEHRHIGSMNGGSPRTKATKRKPSARTNECTCPGLVNTANGRW